MDTPAIQITTKKQPIKNIEVDGVGYKVRPLGAGEMLSVAQAQRKMEKLGKQDFDALTDSQQGQFYDSFGVMLNTLKSTFDDGKDGVETAKLIDRLDPEDITLLIEQVFGNKDSDSGEKTT
jgi:hypothetical protein